MYMKIHNVSFGSDIVAICDRELLNTTICEGDISITIKDTFYGNTVAEKEKVIEAMKSASNLNLIGKKVVSLAISHGIVDNDGFIFINGVPHAQIYRI